MILRRLSCFALFFFAAGTVPLIAAQTAATGQPAVVGAGERGTGSGATMARRAIACPAPKTEPAANPIETALTAMITQTVVEGNVVNSVTGAPITGARVWLERAPNSDEDPLGVCRR